MEQGHKGAILTTSGSGPMQNRCFNNNIPLNNQTLYCENWIFQWKSKNIHNTPVCQRRPRKSSELRLLQTENSNAPFSLHSSFFLLLHLPSSVLQIKSKTGLLFFRSSAKTKWLPFTSVCTVFPQGFLHEEKRKSIAPSHQTYPHKQGPSDIYIKSLFHVPGFFFLYFLLFKIFLFNSLKKNTK